MPQIIALDFGLKRTGIAVTDDLQMIASGLTTLPTKDLMGYLKEYTSQHQVAGFVIGEPKRLHGEASGIETNILEFIKVLRKDFPKIEIHRQDERFTSKLAFDTMLASGISKKRRKDKALVDQISATLILQDFLNYR